MAVPFAHANGAAYQAPTKKSLRHCDRLGESPP
jgi:hypothetical protein